MKMTKFRELEIGDMFDFIGPNRMLNSYHTRCIKLSPRTYGPIDGDDHDKMRVGSINAEVYHVQKPEALSLTNGSEGNDRQISRSSQGPRRRE